MTYKKCLIVFLIFLFFFSLAPLLNAGGPNTPFEDHPWEEVKRSSYPHNGNRVVVSTVKNIYFFSLLPFQPNLVIVVERKSQEEIKEEQSAKTVSLPRKK